MIEANFLSLAESADLQMLSSFAPEDYATYCLANLYFYSDFRTKYTKKEKKSRNKSGVLIVIIPTF